MAKKWRNRKTRAVSDAVPRLMTEAIDAIILCGGAGLRLRPVTGDRPKSMAQVSGRPFLEMLLGQLRRHGFQRVILAVGYAAPAIQSHFGEAFCGMNIEYSNELSPLGTGGALRNAAPRVRSKFCLVMNGDSYTDVDLRSFLAAHCRWRAEVSIVVVPEDERSDTGAVLLDADGNVTQFAEKECLQLKHHLNAGIYILSREMTYGISSRVPLSLEHELLPAWIHNGRRVKGFIHLGKCVDIGTPERYRRAQNVLADAEVVRPTGNEEYTA